jgi:hypothetical protein
LQSPVTVPEQLPSQLQPAPMQLAALNCVEQVGPTPPQKFALLSQ